MVGDWVDFYHPYESEKKIVTRHRVTEIFECGLVGISNHPNPVHADHIEPIKITQEILEKNGWIEDGYFYRAKDGSYIHLGQLFEHATFSCEKHGINREVATSPSMLMYVHQLQQAMRICGIKKEIEL